MDDRELSARIKALNKALASEPASNVVKLLEDLKKDAAPTEEQLRVRPRPLPPRPARSQLVYPELLTKFLATVHQGRSHCRPSALESQPRYSPNRWRDCVEMEKER